MNCPNCGKEVIENQKFCTNCGYTLQNKFITKLPIVALGLVGIFFIFIILSFASYKNSDLTKLQDSIIEKDISTLNLAITMGYAIDGNYNNTDELINKGIIDRLNIIKKENNKIILNDSSLIINKLRENCSNQAYGNPKTTACAEIIVNTDIKFLEKIRFEQDQKSVLLYLFKNGVVQP